jgi:general secretion pathway protein B
MSLILEALKKSEQQRRLGEAPTLGSPVVATRRRRSVLPVLAVLIVIAAGAGWWLTRKPAAPPATSAPPVTAEKQAPVAASATKPGDRNAASSATMQDRLKQEAARRKAEQARRADAPASAKPNPPLGLPNANPAATATVPRKPGDPIPHTMPPQKAPAATAAAPAGLSAKSTGIPKPGDKAPPPAAAPPAGSATATPPSAPARTPAAATPGTAALPTIWELPFATRKDIPALELSMHVYSSDPKQRFVVIKGERHVEGDEIASDLVLKEIRQDGLVLDYKGQKFFFPRSGR